MDWTLDCILDWILDRILDLTSYAWHRSIIYGLTSYIALRFLQRAIAFSTMRARSRESIRAGEKSPARLAQKACRRSLYLRLSGCLWELKWGRCGGVATLRSAGGGWGSILQDYFCWGKYRESQILVVFGRIERVPSIVIQFAV